MILWYDKYSLTYQIFRIPFWLFVEFSIKVLKIIFIVGSLYCWLTLLRLTHTDALIDESISSRSNYSIDILILRMFYVIILHYVSDKGTLIAFKSIFSPHHSVVLVKGGQSKCYRKLWYSNGDIGPNSFSKLFTKSGTTFDSYHEWYGLKWFWNLVTFLFQRRIIVEYTIYTFYCNIKTAINTSQNERSHYFRGQ